ncbi:MAG: tyrosine-type recombinase/integrase [Synergistaceae bacterium]|jgi:integrase|nr:tyrosine-type recombinase/integrase [Synergistaceae bacterium]
MALTELEIKNAKPREKQYSLSDGDGLLLLVKESGAKSWVLRYRMDGKEKRAGLGNYPKVGLAKARELKMDFKRELALGGNPQKKKKEERKEAARIEALKAATFAKIANEWYKQQKKAWSNSNCVGVRHMLDTYLLPRIGERPVREITTRELLSLLLDIEKSVLPTAHRVKGVAGQIFQFAVARGEADFNIVLNLRRALKPKRERHRAALTAPKDIADLVRRIEAYHGSVIVRTALCFLLYTFQRPGEVGGAEWEEIDFDAKLWRIPEQRMKNGRPHLVPLSRQVLELLEYLKRFAARTGYSSFIFPAKSSKAASIHETTLCKALRSMGYTKDQMCAHGFRAIASTNLNEQSWNRDVIELALAHVEKNKVRAAYNHAEHLEERRKMMQAWADWLDGLRQKNSGAESI